LVWAKLLVKEREGEGERERRKWEGDMMDREDHTKLEDE